jgi:hypothetical protein|tara:strand:+ start:165 stop:380 length:216 start_codon:yes stop_codon:yes gene_type:complete
MGGMTRMHFTEVARVINREYTKTHDPDVDVAFLDGYESALWRITSRLATVFEGFNPNFDRVKFIDACTEEV